MPRQITLAITHYNRLPMLLECIKYVQEDPRVGEIVIVDDASTDGSWEKLHALFKDDHSKIRLFRNERNLDCYRNKAEAVGRSSNEWVILFDSDNVLRADYLDVLYRFPEWDPTLIYAPEFARPAFDYRAFSGLIVDHGNVSVYMGESKVQMVVVNRRSCQRREVLGPLCARFRCALNTCNYFVHRDAYLKVWDANAVPHTSDSIYQILNWLKSGRRLLFAKGLQYDHRLHAGSHYQLNKHLTGDFHSYVESQLCALK